MPEFVCKLLQTTVMCIGYGSPSVNTVLSSAQNAGVSFN